MRTQLDDLKESLKDARQNLLYLEWKGMKGSEMYNELKDKEERIASTINNIR